MPAGIHAQPSYWSSPLISHCHPRLTKRFSVLHKSNPAKRHHFIPQMMLRHFADDDGQLWFWRRDFAEDDIRKTATKHLFVEHDL